MTGGDPARETFVTDELPMIKGWAYIAWKIENNGFVDVVNTSPGYIAQEVQRLQQLGKNKT